MNASLANLASQDLIQSTCGDVAQIRSTPGENAGETALGTFGPPWHAETGMLPLHKQANPPLACVRAQEVPDDRCDYGPEDNLSNRGRPVDSDDYHCAACG